MRRAERHYLPFQSATTPESYSSGLLQVPTIAGRLPDAIYVGSYSGSGNSLSLGLADGSTLTFTDPFEGRVLEVGEIRTLTADNDIADLVFLYREGGTKAVPPPIEDTFYLLTRDGDFLTTRNGDRLTWR